MDSVQNSAPVLQYCASRRVVSAVIARFLAMICKPRFAGTSISALVRGGQIEPVAFPIIQVDQERCRFCNTMPQSVASTLA